MRIRLAIILFATAIGAHAQAPGGDAARSRARSEKVTYELYELGKDGDRTLLAKGVREYTQGDVVTTKVGLFGPFQSKEIPVANGFSAGISIFPERDLIGFGLWLKDHGTWIGKLTQGGFSWDWFYRESPESPLVYRKLQGPGRVQVTLVPSSEFQEIAAIEVLEDITLRLNNNPLFRRDDSHNLVITKGSILRFSP
jgi:hypothetical protein